jgi:hypothetical protein
MGNYTTMPPIDLDASLPPLLPERVTQGFFSRHVEGKPDYVVALARQALREGPQSPLLQRRPPTLPLPTSLLAEIIALGGWEGVRTLQLEDEVVASLLGNAHVAFESLHVGCLELCWRLPTDVRHGIHRQLITMFGEDVRHDQSFSDLRASYRMPTIAQATPIPHLAPWRQGVQWLRGPRPSETASRTQLLDWFTTTPPPLTPALFQENINHLETLNLSVSPHQLCRLWSRALPHEEFVRDLREIAIRRPSGAALAVWRLLVAEAIGMISSSSRNLLPTLGSLLMDNGFGEAMLFNGPTLQRALSRWQALDPSHMPLRPGGELIGEHTNQKFQMHTLPLTLATAKALWEQGGRPQKAFELEVIAQRVAITPAGPVRDAFIQEFIIPHCLGSHDARVAAAALAAMAPHREDARQSDARPHRVTP